MQFRVPIDLVFRGNLAGHAKALAGPGSKVNIFAALAAKWAKRIGGAVHTVTATRGAGHNFDMGLWVHEVSLSQGSIKIIQEQRVSSNAASSALG